MFNSMKKTKNLFKKTSIFITISATVFWSMGSAFLISPLPANAALIIPNTIGLVNASFPDAPIKASSNPVAVIKIPLTASQASQYLGAVTVNFSGTDFATTTLADIASDATSGVALYNDAGGTLNSFDGTDVLVATSTGWIGLTSNITLTPQPAISIGTATSTFYIVIRTSATAANNARIIATIPANGVVTTDAANSTGPAANFTANSLKVDTTAPTITSVTGNDSSNDLTVSFSKPVQRFGNGNLTANQFTFVDNGTATSHSTSTVSHTAGQTFAIVTLTGVDSGDFDGSPSTLAAAANGIIDMAGNVMATDAVALTSPISIVNNFVPTATTTGIYGAGNPLVTFTATGGNGNYTWSEVGSNLTDAGFVIDGSSGKLTGTATSSMGNYQVVIKVADNADPIASTTRNFTINVGNASGAVPSISGITPNGGAQNSIASLTISGLNTNFSASSIVEFIMPPGNSGTVGVSTGAITAGLDSYR